MLRRFEASTKLSPVYDFADTVVRGAEPLQTAQLGVHELHSALDETVWTEHLEDHVSRVQIWREEATAKRVLFGPAQRVWRFWMGRQGILRELAKECSTKDKTSAPRVREIINDLEDEQTFRQIVRNTDRIYLRRNYGSDIEARALTQLKGGVGPIIGLAKDWLRLIQTKPNPDGFVETKVNELASDIARLGSSALAAIKNVAAAPEISLPLSATLARSSASIQGLINVFDGKGAETSLQVDTPSRFLSKDLLFVTTLDIDTEFGTVEENPDSVLPLLIDSDGHASTLKAAFDARLARGDLAGAAFACDEMDTIGDPDEDSCREALKEVERKTCRELRNLRVEFTEEIEDCYYFDALSVTDRDNMVAILPSDDNITARGSALMEIERTFEAIRDQLNKCHTRIRERYEKALATVDPRLFDEASARIHDAIESRDWRTVAEQLERLQNGESIADIRWEPDPFESFMDAKRRIENISDELERPTPAEIVRGPRRRSTVAGVSFSSMSGNEVRQAETLLETWFEMARLGQVNAKSIAKILTLLGFVVKHVEEKPDRSVLVTTEPLRQRTLCPLHIFGSSANGKYRVVLNWRVPARDFIIQSVGEVRSNPTIVLHFGRLGKDRERLRKWATRESQRLMLVVDEALVLYLSAKPSGRLPTLFRCAAPFTAVEPFVTTSSLVPPEMFFGRSKEREDVMNRYGSCFVYGGRQLGKTALLRSAEVQFHNPRERRIAKWIDLKSRGIGEDRQPEDIWRLLWRELSDNLLASGRGEPKSNSRLIEEFIQAVKDWTDQRDGSRLLLLLDEADKFLEVDARNDFPVSTRLKGLMDETERRFKVVFSGLHNVLRTTERANHPLVHLGNPICVGPLLSNGEWQAARQLISDPLAVIGCRFKRENIVTHILAHTNYFPSLIQLFGAALVEYLRDSKKVFPYEITLADVYAVFNKDELRQNIRDRFLATLRLDPRYEVIAYAIAYEMAQESKRRDASLVNGMDRSSIMHEVRGWWADGFGATDTEFAALLDEMVGLGVLRVVNDSEWGEKRYSLRNPNVRVLLGGRDDIEEALLREDRELPSIFEPSLFHARYDDDNDSRRRGPLTSEHEGRLKRCGGVTVVSGVGATNIRQIGAFLQGRVDPGMYKELLPCTDAHQFEREVTKLRPDPKRGTHIYLVPLETPWSCRWLRVTVDAWRRMKNRRYIRVVFVAEPDTLWRTLIDLDEEWGIRGVEWVDLGPWRRTFLRQWSADHNLHVEKENEKLLKVSGGWSSVVEKYDLTIFPWRKRVDAIEKMINGDRPTWLKRLGVDSAQVERDIALLAQRLAQETDHLEGTSGEIKLARRFTWMKRLHLLEKCDDGRWSCNSLLKHLLSVRS